MKYALFYSIHQNELTMSMSNCYYSELIRLFSKKKKRV